MNRFFRKINKSNLLIFYILIILLLLFAIYKIVDTLLHPPLYVVIQFEDLGPVYKRMPVYYKGYKIGITKKIEPSKDYKTTLVTVNFYPKELKLPSNTTAKVKKLNMGVDYIELLYPKNPSAEYMQTGEIIEGETTMDIQSFMSAQVESGNLGNLIDTSNQTLNSITATSKSATRLLTTANSTLNENRKNIKITTYNLSKTTDNLAKITYNLNSSLDKNKLETTTSNIEEITENIKILTENLNDTVERANSTMCELNGAAKNINKMTKDVQKSVSKRKGLTGILLGKEN